MPGTSRAKRRSLNLLMIILVPLVPAVLVQYFVLRSPPGASITPMMSEALAAMQEIAQPRADSAPLGLSFSFTSGEIFAIDLERRRGETSRPEARRFRLEVQEAGPTSARLALIPVAPDGARVLGRERLVLRWDSDGYLEAEGDDIGDGGDLRDRLLRQEGILLPGPYLREARENDWLAPPGAGLTPAATELLRASGLRRGEEEMPHRGGLLAGAASAGRRTFHYLGYRRHALVLDRPDQHNLDRAEKVGFCEAVVRGSLEGPDAGLAPGESELRIIEHLCFDRDGREIDETLVIHLRQSLRRIEGGNPR